jgi:hypothetical protein
VTRLRNPYLLNFSVVIILVGLGLFKQPARALRRMVLASAAFVQHPQQSLASIYSKQQLSRAVPVSIVELIETMRRNGIESFQVSPSLMRPGNRLRQQVIREAWPIHLSNNSSAYIVAPDDSIEPVSCPIIFEHSGIHLVDCRPNRSSR